MLQISIFSNDFSEKLKTILAQKGLNILITYHFTLWNVLYAMIKLPNILKQNSIRKK